MGLHCVNTYQTCQALKLHEPVKLQQLWYSKFSLGDVLKVIMGFQFRVNIKL